MSWLDGALAKVSSPDYSVTQEGLDEISDRRKTRRDGLRLIQAAAADYPEYLSYRSRNALLLQFFQGWHHPDFIPALEKIYDALQAKAEAREMVLRSLMNDGSPEARRAVVRLLGRLSSRDVGVEVTLYVPLRDTPPAGLCMFPELFEVIPNLVNRYWVYRVVLAYAQSGLLDLNHYPAFRTYCLARAGAILAHECGGRDSPESQESDRRYLIALMELRILLDVLRFFPAPEVDSLLAHALEHPHLFPDLPGESTLLKLIAAGSLLGRGQRVDPAQLEALAVGLPCRWRLWEHLETVGRLDAFPARYRNQKDLAECEMVQWLEHPHEVSQVPEQLELLTVVRYRDAAGVAQSLYFYKFRHPAFYDGEWFVGMAGPYPADGPARLGGPKTFSVFNKLAEKSLDEHTADYLPDEATNMERIEP